MQTDERGYIIPTPPNPKRGRYARITEYTMQDPAKLTHFWSIAKRIAAAWGWRHEDACDFAQEATLAYARNGWVRFELARMGYWNKFVRKWAMVIDESVDVELSGNSGRLGEEYDGSK